MNYRIEVNGYISGFRAKYTLSEALDIAKRIFDNQTKTNPDSNIRVEVVHDISGHIAAQLYYEKWS